MSRKDVQKTVEAMLNLRCPQPEVCADKMPRQKCVACKVLADAALRVQVLVNKERGACIKIVQEQLTEAETVADGETAKVLRVILTKIWGLPGL